MKFEPWISINLLLICLSIGFLSLRIEPNTRTTLNAAEVSTYLKIRYHLGEIYSIISLDNWPPPPRKVSGAFPKYKLLFLDI